MKNNKLVALMIISPAIIFGTLCKDTLKVNALESTTISSTYSDDNSCPKSPCPRGAGLLKESVNELKESGVLTEDDVKNIDSYMVKDRQAKEEEIKEQIYNKECEKIDKMVSEKVISKEKGEKLKVEVKENIKNLKQNMRKQNNK